MIQVSVSGTDLAAKLFRSLSDPTRLAILLELLVGERCVTDLVETTHRSQPTVSEHLACLRGCGLVEMRPEGRQSIYALASPEVIDVLLAAQRLLVANGEKVQLCPVHLERWP